MPGIYHQACCCAKCECPCVGDEVTMTISMTGNCLCLVSLNYCFPATATATVVRGDYTLTVNGQSVVFHDVCQLIFSWKNEGEHCVTSYLSIYCNPNTGRWEARLSVDPASWCGGAFGWNDLGDMISCTANGLTGEIDIVGGSYQWGPNEQYGYEGCTMHVVLS